MKEPLQYILSSFLSNMTGMKSWTGNRGRLKQCFSWKAYSVARMGHCQAAMLSFNWKVSAIDFQSFHPSFTFLLCRNILMKTKGDTETSTDPSLFCKCDFRESLFTFKIVYSTSWPICVLLAPEISLKVTVSNRARVASPAFYMQIKVQFLAHSSATFSQTTGSVFVLLSWPCTCESQYWCKMGSLWNGLPFKWGDLMMPKVEQSISMEHKRRCVKECHREVDGEKR